MIVDKKQPVHVFTSGDEGELFLNGKSVGRKVFNGLCLMIIRGKPGQPGRIQVTAKADGLKMGTASIKTRLEGN